MDGVVPAAGWTLRTGGWWAGLRLCGEHNAAVGIHLPTAEVKAGVTTLTCGCAEHAYFTGEKTWYLAHGWWQDHIMWVQSQSEEPTSQVGTLANRCESCGTAPHWRIDRSGDAMVTWACKDHLGGVVADAYRTSGTELTFTEVGPS
jgi:hypothetical protein